MLYFQLPLSVARFVVQESAGRVDFEAFFPGKRVTVDPVFRELVSVIGPRYSTRGFACNVLQTFEGGNEDDFIREKLGFRDSLNGNRICAALSHLGSSEMAVIRIPEGCSDARVILGYAMIGDICLVLFVEHEYKDGLDKINLSAQNLNQWGRDTPLVIMMG